MKIKIADKSKHEPPSCPTETSTGMDLKSNMQIYESKHVFLINIEVNDFIIGDDDRICR